METSPETTTRMVPCKSREWILRDPAPFYTKRMASSRGILGHLLSPVFVPQRSEGGVCVSSIGTVDDNSQDPDAVKARYAEQAVEALLWGKEVPLETTMAISWSIKA